MNETCCPHCGSEGWDRITDRNAPGASYNRCNRCEREWEPADMQDVRANLKEAIARGRDPYLSATQCAALVVLIDNAPAQKPPCAVCGTPWKKHGSYPTCATHPYTADGSCQYVIGAQCVGAECKGGCVRSRAQRIVARRRYTNVPPWEVDAAAGERVPDGGQSNG